MTCRVYFKFNVSLYLMILSPRNVTPPCLNHFSILPVFRIPTCTLYGLISNTINSHGPREYQISRVGGGGLSEFVGSACKEGLNEGRKGGIIIKGQIFLNVFFFSGVTLLKHISLEPLTTHFAIFSSFFIPCGQ